MPFDGEGLLPGSGEPLNPARSLLGRVFAYGGAGLRGRAAGSASLLNLQQLDIKQQRGVRRNDAARTAGAVA